MTNETRPQTVERRAQELVAALIEMEEGYRERCNYCGGHMETCERLSAPSGCRAQNARALTAAGAEMGKEGKL